MGIGVFAYGTSSPSTFGHTASEVFGLEVSSLTQPRGDPITDPVGMQFSFFDNSLQHANVYEAPASWAGRVYSPGVGGIAIQNICSDADGCKVTLTMVNWDLNGFTASKEARLFVGTGTTGTRAWRLSNDIQGNDFSGVRGTATTGIEEWCAWDCCLTDAETFTDTSRNIVGNNGRGDYIAGFGLLNMAGGSYSDQNTVCRLIVED